MKALAIVLLLSVAASAGAQKTYANPLDLDYRFMPEPPSRREASDPFIALHRDDYYLFASRSGGYWYSSDMRAWKLVVPDGLPVEDSAPSAVSIDGRLYYTSSRSHGIYTSDYPRVGHWRRVAYIDEYAEPDFFLDDDGKLFLYFTAAAGISVVQLDPSDNFRVVGAPRVLLKPDTTHGWERAAGALGGPRMTKHDGVYYLQYAAAGDAGKGSADGVYLSRSPTSGFTYAPYSPFAHKPGGFVGSAAHGAMFKDKSGRPWRVTTLNIGVLDKGEQRIGLFPAGWDNEGVIRTNTYLGDYPQFLPGEARHPLDDNRPPWMLLSAGKDVTASSTLDGHDARFALDEDIRTQWSAKTDEFGEWLKVDLGGISMIYAIQVNFGEQDTRALSRDSTGAQRYTINISLDGRRWTAIVDGTHPSHDSPHAYVELPTPSARYVMITNASSAAGGLFSIRELRVFGKNDMSGPPEVKEFTVKRSASDDRSATITWTRVPRATGYVVRFGITPDKLYGNFQVGNVDTVTLTSLNSGVPYYFTVDALGEGGIARGRRVVQ